MVFGFCKTLQILNLIFWQSKSQKNIVHYLFVQNLLNSFENICLYTDPKCKFQIGNETLIF